MKKICLIIVIVFTSCCPKISVNVSDSNGLPIRGAYPVPTPIIGATHSDKNGILTVCKGSIVGVAATGYKAYIKRVNGKFLEIYDKENIVLSR